MEEEVGKPSGNGFKFREKVVAMLCLTFLGAISLLKMDDPENILINVIVAIAAFVSGASVARSTDK